MTERQTTTFTAEAHSFCPSHNGRVIPLGMGCATIGNRGDTVSLETAQAALRRAYERGLRYIDTSAKYGGSEFRVGRFLRDIPRESVFVATKSPIPPQLSPEEAAFHVRQSLQNSLERLGLSQIDLFQIHDVDRLDQVLAPDGILSALHEARQAGLIRYIGLATRFHELLEAAVDNGGFDTILTYRDFTPVNFTATATIAKAAKAGMGVINGTPMAGGLLTGPDPRKGNYSGDEARRWLNRAIKLYDFCAERGISLLALGMQYPQHNPGISITLSGPGSPEEVDTNFDASCADLPADIWSELSTHLGIPPPMEPVTAA